MQKKWLIPAVLLLLASFAQSSVTVHAKLGSSQANVLAAPYLHFELLNCGYNIPQYPASSLVVVGKTVDLKPNQADGSIVGSILGNDEILCGNVASTQYRMTPMLDENTPAGPPQTYAICTPSAIHPENCSTVATLWDPAFAPVASQPPPQPGYVTIFGNPVSNQTWKQPTNTKATFLGVFDFTGATVLGLSGTTVQVNGLNVQNPNFGLLPAAPANFINCTFVVSGVNVSLGCPTGNTSAQFAPGSGSTAYAPATGSTIYAPLISPTFSGTVTVPTPVNGTDAVTKTYADSLLTGGSNATQIQGRTVINTAPNDTDYLGWNAGAARWEPKTLSASSNATQLQGTAVDATGPTLNQILQFDGTKWKPTTVAASTNAAQIQGVAVDATAPTDGQAQVYDSGLSSYKAKGVLLTSPATGDQTVTTPVGKTLYVDSVDKVRTVVPADNWVQSPAADLSASGAGKVITLTPCPKGIDVSNTAATPFYVWIATIGTPEAALVTGGTCTSGGTTGNIVVTTAQTHSAGYTVGSAYAGLQEAVNDIGNPNGRLVIPPLGGNTSYDLKAKLFLKSNKLHVSAYGAVIGCQVRSSCVWTGDNTNTNFQYVKWYGGRFKSLINVDGAQITSVSTTSNITTVGTAAAHNLVNGDEVSIEYYAGGDTFRGFGTVTVLSATSYSFAHTHADYTTATAFGWTALKVAAFEMTGEGGTIKDVGISPIGSPNKFHFAVIVDNDQKAVIDNLTNEGSGNVLRCTANFCGSMVRARGDSGNAGVVYIKDSEFSMQCGGNGVLATNGNSLHVSDTVIQGFNQYGVRYDGGLQGAKLTNVYEEVGVCTNPIYPGSNQGQAGIITGGKLNIDGPGPIAGQIPRFANTGANQRNYYVVPKSTIYGAGPIMLAGYALSSGSGTINVYWPEISEDTAGTVTYDVLMTTGALGNATAAPYLGNATSIATAQTGSCTNAVCTFADTQAAGSAYTVVSQGWQPNIWFWPGMVTMTTAGNFATSHGIDVFVTSDQLQSNNFQGFISSVGATQASMTLGQCPLGTAWSPIQINCVGATAYAPQTTATLLQQRGPSNSGPAVNSKGRLNFGRIWATPTPNHLITLIDANFDKTAATPGLRPLNDANDCFFGIDQGNSAATLGLSIGCGTSISQYIGNVGDGTNWLTRLNVSSFTVKPNTTFNGNVTILGTCTGCGSGPSLGSANLIPVMNAGATNFTYNPNFSIDPVTGLLTVPGGIHSLAGGPWSIEGPFGPMTDAAVGNTKCGYDIDGALACSYNGVAQVKMLRKGEAVPADVILSGTWPLLSADFLDGFDSSIAATAASTVVVSATDGTIDPTRIPYGIIPKTADYTPNSSDHRKLIKMNCAGACNVHLPAPPFAGYQVRISNISAGGAVSILRDTCACFINGLTTTVTLNKGQILTFVSDATDYQGSAPLAGDTTTGVTVGVSGQNLKIALDPTVSNALLGSAYTNATTGFTNVTGLAFGVAANTNYALTCELYYQTSVNTANIKLGFTGPAAPTSVHYSADIASTSTASAGKLVANAFAASLAGTGTPTATTDLPIHVAFSMHNGANAGTVQLQAAATAAGTVTLEADSFCQLN